MTLQKQIDRGFIGIFDPEICSNFRAKNTHEFMINLVFESHRPILYLKRQQKVHLAKRFENLRSRQHGLLDTVHCELYAVKVRCIMQWVLGTVHLTLGTVY